MTTDELLVQLDRLIAAIRDAKRFNIAVPQVREFLRVYGGKGNSFLQVLDEIDPWGDLVGGPAPSKVQNALISFREYIEAGLHGGVSPERKAQLDVVSDFLGMAQQLLETKNVHPAAPAVLIGATIEEFLRNWIEHAELSLGNRKPGLENYSIVLRDADLISKQDGKDITSWAGVRNHAAHGEWEEVSDKARIRLMLEGVNLFMRKYTP